MHLSNRKSWWKIENNIQFFLQKKIDETIKNIILIPTTKKVTVITKSGETYLANYGNVTIPLECLEKKRFHSSEISLY